MMSEADEFELWEAELKEIDDKLCELAARRECIRKVLNAKPLIDKLRLEKAAQSHDVASGRAEGERTHTIRVKTPTRPCGQI